MGFFSFLKGKNTNDLENKMTYKRNIVRLFALIEENMYINERKTLELFEQMYKITENDVIHRHLLYNKMIDYFYGLREQQPTALDKCIKYCKESIEHTPIFLKADKQEFLENPNNKNFEYIPPHVESFKRLAIIYENQGMYDDAIKICNLALRYNLKDGTKSGYEGRKERLLKKSKVMK